MKPAEQLIDFVGNSETIQVGNAVVVQSKLGRERECHTVGRSPVDQGPNVVRGLVSSKAVAVAESAVHLNSGLKLFAAESAVVSAGRKLQRTAHSPGISELPEIVGKVFLRDDVFADIPPPVIAAENQFQLQFAFF